MGVLDNYFGRNRNGGDDIQDVEVRAARPEFQSLADRISQYVDQDNAYDSNTDSGGGGGGGGDNPPSDIPVVTVTAKRPGLRPVNIPVDSLLRVPKINFDIFVEWTQQGGSGSTDARKPGKQVTAYIQGRPSTITVFPVSNGKYLRADAAVSFKAMQAAALKAGIKLSVNSGFRTMAEQQVLYAKYLNGTGNKAAQPGYSNHQNGIAVDIGGVKGYGTPAFKWLSENAGSYGFVNDVKGEYWHWTYRKPRSS